MVTLRSGIKTDGMENLVHSNENDGEMSLEDKIEQISLSLKQVQDTLSKSIESRDIEIYKLQTRVNVLESHVKLGQHFSVLYERKMDDMEQISRKVNLRLKGIEVSRNDSPAIIMEKIKEELIVNNVDLPPSEIDRCHRVGSRYVQNGKTYQDVLVKFGFWRSIVTQIETSNHNMFQILILASRLFQSFIKRRFSFTAFCACANFVNINISANALWQSPLKSYDFK